MGQRHDERSCQTRIRIHVMAEEIVNRVANSSLVQIDLDDFLPEQEVIEYDLEQNLYEGLILREGDFREFLKNHDWSVYKNRAVAIYCSTDAIIPNWAYMLLSSKLNSAGAIPVFGDKKNAVEKLMLDKFKEGNTEVYKGKKVILKGCGLVELSPSAYTEITSILQPLVSSLMFGEACSTVPVYKSGS